MSLQHYIHIKGEAVEHQVNDAPYAVGDRVSIDLPAPAPNAWVRITGKRCITNNVTTAIVHWEAELDQ